MMTFIWQCIIILAVVAAIGADEDIEVKCGKNSVTLKWILSPESVTYAPRLFLGNCFPSKFSVLPNGQGEVLFHSRFTDCKFKRVITTKKLIYRNELTFRPYAKALRPAAFTYPIECVYKRPEGWIPHFLNPGSGTAEGRGGLNFHMAILNEDLSAISRTSVFSLGSHIPIWAAVEQKDHQPLLILLEECVAATTPDLQSYSQVYPIILNKGCLVDGKKADSRFLPRYHSSAIILLLQSFKFAPGEEVYIHCKLVAWDPELLNEGKKVCNYNNEHGGWELLDDPSHSALCNCCDSHLCKSRSKRGVGSEPQGLVQHTVLGPLTIVDSSETLGNKTSVESLTAEEVGWTV